MTNKNTLQDIGSLRNSFHSDLPQRLSALNTLLHNINRDHGCGFYALVRRLLDVFQLLGYQEIDQLNMAFNEAETAYKEQKQLDKVKQLINKIGDLANSLTAGDYIDIDIEGIKTEVPECKVYLLVEEQKSRYLNEILTDKDHVVYFLSNQTPISEQINKDADGVFVIDEDTEISGGDAIEIIREVKKNNPDKFEYILISESADFNKRLTAVRENITLVNNGDLSCGAVLRAIDQVALKQHKTNSRVLLISTDEVMSGYISRLLSSAGMAVTIINDFDEEQMSVIGDRPFDLIMIDYFLGEIYGFEVSQIIRQYDYYAYVPIVFLYSKINLTCDLNPELLSRHGHVMKKYDPESVVEDVSRIISKTSDSHIFSQYMSDSLHESSNMHYALDAHCIVSTTDIFGRITDVNDRFCEVSGYTRDELIGETHGVINSGYHPKKLFSDMWKTISSGKIWHGEICNKKKDGQLYWVESTIVPYLNKQGNPYQYISLRTEVTRIKNAELDLEKQKNLLVFLKNGLTRFVDEDDFLLVAESILEGLLKITGSNYGFIGSVAHDGLRPYLKMHAARSFEWDESIVEVYHRKCTEGLEIHDMDNLIGDVITNRKHVICNDVKNELGDRKVPKSHPDMSNFLGVPIVYGNNLVGVYGLANKEGGYSQQDMDFLKPFNATYSAIIHAKYMADVQKDTLTLVKQSKTQVMQASQAKSHFLSSMSHELRTPMNAILGFGQLLSMEIGHALSDEQRDNVKEIMKAGNHLLELINEILDLSRIEAGKIDLNIEPVLLSNAINESVVIIESQAEKSIICIEYQINGEPSDFSQIDSRGIKIYADFVRIKQVLLNLLSNAAKYNKQDGKIIIDIEMLDKEGIRINVKDTGVGIPLEKQNELFQSFQRLGAEATEVEGTGIGLVITKEIVELMGGTIGYESQSGVGSTFWVDLLRCEENTEEVKGDSISSIDIENGGNKKIVYIEDNPANMRLVSQLLSSFGHIKLITAHEPKLGMMLIDQHKPDLILLDINLPEISGIEVIGELRKATETADTPVIAISANAMQSDIQQAMDAGFKDYITKPIDVPRFMKVLSDYLQ